MAHRARARDASSLRCSLRSWRSLVVLRRHQQLSLAGEKLANGLARFVALPYFALWKFIAHVQRQHDWTCLERVLTGWRSRCAWQVQCRACLARMPLIWRNRDQRLALACVRAAARRNTALNRLADVMDSIEARRTATAFRAWWKSEVVADLRHEVATTARANGALRRRTVARRTLALWRRAHRQRAEKLEALNRAGLTALRGVRRLYLMTWAKWTAQVATLQPLLDAMRLRASSFALSSWVWASDRLRSLEALESTVVAAVRVRTQHACVRAWHHHLALRRRLRAALRTVEVRTCSGAFRRLRLQTTTRGIQVPPCVGLGILGKVRSLSFEESQGG